MLESHPFHRRWRIKKCLIFKGMTVVDGFPGFVDILKLGYREIVISLVLVFLIDFSGGH